MTDNQWVATHPNQLRVPRKRRPHAPTQKVFSRRVFDNDQLALRDDMTASDIEGWGFRAHINLMFGIEQAFGVRLGKVSWPT